MAQEEVFGTRDRTYSAWHRRMSLRRYIGIERAQTASMIDLDASLYVEYDDATKEPLALIETAEDRGQPFKPATVTKNLAERAGIPAYVLLYRKAEKPNPADPRCSDISYFRVRRLAPNEEPAFRVLMPQAWADALMTIRSWAARRVDDRLDEEATSGLAS